MGKISDPGDGTFNYYTGAHMLLRGEPALVKQAVEKIGIALNDFDVKIVGIYARPRSIGFDFYPHNVKALLDAVQSNAAMKEDDRQTKGGRFVASNSHGLSFRQVGTGRSLHFIISFTQVCNVHIDSTGFVESCGYNAIRALGHGYWDLAPGCSARRLFLVRQNRGWWTHGSTNEGGRWRRQASDRYRRALVGA